MNKSQLYKEYMDENTFWHITSKHNLESIALHGLVPRDGKRNGESKSAEDPVPRVFFSQGLEAVLAQANNLAYIVDSFIKKMERTSTGNSGKDVKEKMQNFIDNSSNDKITENYTKNGGFIDLIYFVKDDIFKNGINESLTEQYLDKIVYDIVKTIWENNVCLKANLEDGIDYSWNDYNFNSSGTKKVPMTKKNMHAFEGHTINPSKIEIIADENGNLRTTWDVFKEMALIYKKEHPEKDYLPVEEWESGYEDEKGKMVYTGEIHHEKDFLSLFIEMEEIEQLKTNKQNISEGQDNRGIINTYKNLELTEGDLQKAYNRIAQTKEEREEIKDEYTKSKQ